VTKVVASSCETYDVDKLASLLARSFKEIGFTWGGAKILLKPNLLSGRAPDKAVNTDPRFVQAVAEVLRQDRCEIWVGDSPGFETTEGAMERSGIASVIRKLGLNQATFEGRVTVAGKGLSPYSHFVFGEDPRTYDVIINLPKLKTHTMMGLTAGVKNTFGFVPRFEKAKWHLKCGTDTLLFSSVLIDIHATVAPALTILDGILGMEGDGPSSGRPRKFGLVAVSESSFALDLFLEEALRISVPLPINMAIREKDLVAGYDLVDWHMPPISGVRMPATTMSIQWNLKGRIGQAVRGLFVKKPKQDIKRCTGCTICVQVCPPQALKMANGKIHFDYERCIRCYCCHEMCPTGSIKL
jgi:uncharacterized protein (DUF362 family)/NAD-dependent dihydropyrimidine dehydrogenase PreA subunit